jgi:hypothetical protein
MVDHMTEDLLVVHTHLAIDGLHILVYWTASEQVRDNIFIETHSRTLCHIKTTVATKFRFDMIRVSTSRALI